MDRLLLCHIYFSLLTSNVVYGYTVVEVTLKQYMVDGNHYDGSKCDAIWGPLGRCDPEFIFCFDAMNGTNDMNICSFKRIKTRQWDNTNTVIFGDKFSATTYDWDNPWAYYEMNNPIFVDGLDNSYRGFRLKVAVYDNDIDGDDLIDLMYFNFTKDPAGNSTTAVNQQHIVNGTRLSSPSNLTIETRVYCGDNSYRNDCSVYCYSYSGNNYICDPNTGEKICRPGFESPQEDCSVKIDDCEMNACANGGTCLDGYKSYTCACLRNYTGPYCQYHKCDLQANFCKNGATCSTDDLGDLVCSCRSGFQGITCSEPINAYGNQPQIDSKEGFPVWAIAIIIVVIVVIAVAIMAVVILKRRTSNVPTANSGGNHMSNPSNTSNVYVNGPVPDTPPTYVETAQPLSSKEPPPYNLYS